MQTQQRMIVRFGKRWQRIAICLILVVMAVPWVQSSPPAQASGAQRPPRVPAPLPTAHPIPTEGNAAFPSEALAAATSFCQGETGNWSSSSSSFSVFSSCTLTLPTSSMVFLKASASVGLVSGGGYEALFAFGLNGTEVAHPRRWVDVATDTGDGADTGLALSRMLLLPSGIHTVGLIGALSHGTGPAYASDPAFSAVVVPTRPGWTSCSSPSLNSWSTTATQLETVTSCTLTVATTSTLYLDGNASVGLPTAGTNYEGLFQLSVDGGDLASPQRKVNIYTNSNNGTDKSLAISRSVTVGPGTHTIGLRGRLSSGAGPLKLYFPSLSALALPDQGGVARCSATGATWSTSTPTYTVLSACSLTLTTTSTVYVGADASLGLSSGGADYEGLLALGANTNPLLATRRRINIATDAGDGTDLPASLSHLLTMGPGTHTFQLLGTLSSQGGPAKATDATISAFVVGRPDIKAYLPLVRK